MSEVFPPKDLWKWVQYIDNSKQKKRIIFFLKNLPFALTNAITVHNNTNNLGYPAIWELNIPANITFIYFFIIILFTLVSFGFIPALSCFWYEVVWSTVSVCVCVCVCVCGWRWCVYSFIPWGRHTAIRCDCSGLIYMYRHAISLSFPSFYRRGK